MTATDLETQIRDELAQVAWRLGPLLGLDIVDTLEQRTGDRAPMLAGILTGGDDHQSAEVCIDIIAALWPHSDPPPAWWRTPLGRALAASAGMDGSEAVSMSVAAAMLGVSPGRATQLADGGKLDRHPDGGVTRASVMARIDTTS